MIATITGVGGQIGSELEEILPTFVYYAGTTATGTPLPRSRSITVGTYTVVAEFPGSADYEASTSDPSYFVVPGDP